MLRALILTCILGGLAGCQTSGADTEGVLGSAVGTDQAQVSAIDPEQALVTDEQGNPIAEGEANETEAETEIAAAPASPAASSGSDIVLNGLRDIAALRKKGGERAAIEAVFACYKQARARSVRLGQARVCAAQDFAVSREVIAARPAGATGTGDRALFISKRHAERIGALMKLKGMNQSQFNTFGRYLHAVAEPAYQEARRS